MNSQNILEVKHLNITANTAEGSKVLVSDVSFSLSPGKVLGIVGESGSGKSITCFAIAGLLHPALSISAGEIYFRKDEEELILNKISSRQYRQLRGKSITMVFQEPMSALNPVQCCGDQVAEVLFQHTSMSKSEVKQEVIKLFEQVKLPSPERMYHSYPHQLSGGQKQRVVIAMAIACKPEILIADEPTTALDVTVQKEIVALLSEISRTSNMSIIFITHDLALISEIADDVLVMYQGKVEEYDTKEVIFTTPKSPYTKGLMACRPRLGSKTYRLPVVSDFLNNTDVTYSLIPDREISANEESIEGRAKLLEIHSLSKYFKSISTHHQVKAVDDVSLHIYAGETLGLVGESGCGKSTLSRAILMLDPPSKGQIFYKGRDISNMSASQIKELRRDMQIIFQDPFASLNPMLSIGETLLEPMRVHSILKNDRQRKEYISELLIKVGLSPDIFNRYPHEFSGGQRQRIGIARALVLQPSFIICDESVSALDVSVQAQVLNLLNDLKDDFSFTYLFISHDLSVVQYMSDHLAVMQNGKIKEYGRTNTVYQHPKTSYTQHLMSAIPSISKK